MFRGDILSRRRVVIVDFNHIAYSYAFSGAKALSATINMGGESQLVDTTIPSYSIKTLHRWANNGGNPLAVCFDGQGSSRSRKAYFTKLSETLSPEDKVDYKGGRKSNDSRFYDGINLTINFLMGAGIGCYKADGYEADDLIKACVDRAKVDYPDLPIDIITCDHDLLPLVDSQVSVFMRSRATTYAEDKAYQKMHYVQVTPRNYESFISGLNTYAKLTVPYNTVLLTKLLRGDKSDNIPGKSDWKPKLYNKLIDILIERNIDLSDLFRYGKNVETYFYKDSNLPIPSDQLATTPTDNITIQYEEPLELTNICNTLTGIVEQADIDHIRRVYTGLNLNGAYNTLGTGYNRRPAKITSPIVPYNPVLLQSKVSVLKINLPVV